MEIYLVRHIEPNFEKGVCYGQLDVSIPNDFTEKHEVIIAKLPKSYDAVFSSPLTRCKLLAEQISNGVVFDDRLKEVNFGDWEGKNWDDINQSELNNWMQNYINIAPPNGESLTDLINRFSDFVTDLKNRNFKKVIIVTHAGILRSASHVFKKMPLDEIMMQKVDFGEIVRFNLKLSLINF